MKLIYDSNHKDANVEELEGDGDFRSEECVELLKQADVVVTNPPFSLASLYIQQLVKYDKKFLVMGTVNNITYKEIFPLIKANKMWIGYNFNKTMEFQLGEGYEKWNEIRDGKKYGIGPGIAWYTNLDVKKHHEKLVLTEHYDPAKYPKFDNYDAINVDKTVDIPKDYYGVIGVPITFFGKYNPEQFEIVGKMSTTGIDPSKFEFGYPYVNGKKKYTRILIRKKPVSENTEMPTEDRNGTVR